MLQISAAVTHTGLTKKVDGGDPAEPTVYRPSGKLNFGRVCPADDVQGPLAVDFAKEELKARTIFILDEKALYGQGLAALVTKRCQELGIQILGHDSINTKQNEFRALMALKVAHRGYVLETGRIRFTDKADVLLHDPRIRAAYLGE